MVSPEPPVPDDPQEPPAGPPDEPGPGSPDDAHGPPAGPPAKPTNRKLVIAIVAAVVVLVGGGVTIAAIASNDSPEEVALRKDTADARAVVEKFAVLFGQARNDGAFAVSKDEVKALLCAQEQNSLDLEWQDRENKEINRSYAPTPSARLTMTVRDVRIHGDSGVATLTGAIADRRTDQDFELLKQDGQWKVCGVAFRIPKAPSSPEPPSTSATPSDSNVPSTSETTSTNTTTSTETTTTTGTP
jgi:hypothetical protein